MRRALLPFLLTFVALVARAQVEVTLKNPFINTYADRATITATYTALCGLNARGSAEFAVRPCNRRGLNDRRLADADGWPLCRGILGYTTAPATRPAMLDVR
jgi:hypothetical protein